MSTKVVTGKVRFSYLNVFTPRLPPNPKEGDVPKYNVTLLIPKSDKATLAKMKAAFDEAAAAKFPKLPAKLHSTLHDGDGTKPETGEPFGDECTRHMVIVVASKNKPGLVDASMNEVIDPTAWNSGDFGKASINAYAYEYQGKKGVSFGLNNLQFLSKGESLGAGRSRAEDDFEAEEDEALN